MTSLFRKAIRPASSATPKDIVSHGSSTFTTWTIAGLSGYSHAPLAESRDGNTYLGKWPMFYLSDPLQFRSPTRRRTRQQKNPAELYSTGFLYPIALMYSHQSLLGKPTISKKPATPLRRNPFDPAGLNPVPRCARSKTSSGGGQQAPRKAQHLLRPPGRRAA